MRTGQMDQTEVRSREPPKSRFCAKEQSSTNKAGANKRNRLRVIYRRPQGPNQDLSSNKQPVNNLSSRDGLSRGGR